MPFAIGAVQEFQKARKGVLIKDAHIGELEKVLRRMMLLVGIRANNLPGREETALLTAFILKKYKGLTLQEIHLAFEKAVAGELEVDADCFENFSCQYFGRIMAAYKKWASQKFSENQYAAAYKELPQVNGQPDWKELCEIYYQDYRKDKLNFDLMPAALYDEFYRSKMMSDDAYEDFLSDAKTVLINQYIVYRDQCTSSSEYREWNDKLDALKDGKAEEKIMTAAKKLAVIFLYQTARNKKFENLFEL